MRCCHAGRISKDPPQEAFLSVEEVSKLPRGHVGDAFETCGCCMTADKRADKPLRIIAISYGWLTAEHPDPHGEQLARVATQIERERQCCPGRWGEVGYLLFWNALCLGFCAGYCCCCVIPYRGQQCGEFGVFYE